ncbi:MAG: DUF4783 domain-containing protein [Bacteroidia bacterium]|nr:DUF4783 domain-containing protein [Bacteroidia bacterium]
MFINIVNNALFVTKNNYFSILNVNLWLDVCFIAVTINKMKKTISLLLLLFAFNQSFALDVFDEIALAIRSGDAKQLSTYFGPTLDLTIVSREDVYSKAQAEQVIKDFFSKNAPKSFTIIHKGSSPEGNQYAIGNLVTNTGKTYRTSFYFKTSGGKNVLMELRFETE